MKKIESIFLEMINNKKREKGRDYILNELNFKFKQKIMIASTK
jgi:hypothetical protein